MNTLSVPDSRSSWARHPIQDPRAELEKQPGRFPMQSPNSTVSLIQDSCTILVLALNHKRKQCLLSRWKYGVEFSTDLVFHGGMALVITCLGLKLSHFGG